MWRTRQFLRERRPWPSPDLGRYLCGPYKHTYTYTFVYVCVCIACMHVRAGTRALHFLSPRLSFVCTFGPEESKEGQQRQEKKTGRGRDLLHCEARLFGREISPAFPVVATDNVSLFCSLFFFSSPFLRAD